MIHPSFGVVPADKFKEAEAASAGRATAILRQYDHLFGLVKAGQQVKRFSMKCKQRKTVDEYCTVEIEALDEKQARDIICMLPDDKFNWDEDFGSEDEDDFEVMEIKEVTP